MDLQEPRGLPAKNSQEIRVLKLPETLLEFREWQRLGRFRTIREDCGISGTTIAEALGVCRTAVYEWELGRVPVSSLVWEKYVRVIRGLMNHLEVRE